VKQIGIVFHGHRFFRNRSGGVGIVSASLRSPFEIVEYLKGRPTSLVVYLSFAVFLILWPAGFLEPYGVTVETILGGAAIALSSIGSGHILDKWIIASIG
jgi:hypothetical protein